jgi:CIC family chloride channel protein
MPRHSLFRRLHHRLHHTLESVRLELSRAEAILPLSILGLVAGTLAAATIIALRLMVDNLQLELYPMAAAEHFEALEPAWRLGIALGGGVLIGFLYRFTRESSHTVGVLHVLERLAQHQGRLPWRNTLVQFIGGGISMVAGHSVGREGPSAHLGAASSNLPAQALNFPNNSLRVLAACGAAAGIAASFNTPLAGAVFAMEVLLMEYTVAGFVPIIMATVSATALSRAVFGHHLAYNIPPMDLGSLVELPYILFCGVAIGVLAAGFSRLFQLVSSQGQRLPNWLRPMLGGLVVGVCGMAVPQVMGIGDDTVNSLLVGEAAVGLLLLILVVKLIATTGGIGLGLPGGIIGPALFIGAAAGALLSALGAKLGLNGADAYGFYALLGMGAMMAGTMMAPMAGLIAILELTGEPNIILPGMLAIVAATITSGRLSGRESLFHSLLRSRGLIYRTDPLAQSLRRIGVAVAMNRHVAVLPRRATAEQVDEALVRQPQWILVREEEKSDTLLKAVALVVARKELPDEEQYDLMDIPGDRLQAAAIDIRATLQEAQDRMRQSGAEVLYVIGQTVPGLPRVQGVLTQEEIDDSYRY